MIAVPLPFRPSPTKIQDGEQCMLKLKLLHIDGLEEDEEEPNKHLSFGNTIHEVLQLAHAGPRAPEREELLGWLKTYWIRHEARVYARKHGVPIWRGLGYESENEERQYYNDGLSMLDDYYVGEIQSGYRQAWKLEHYRQFQLPSGHPIAIKIDRVDRLEDGRYRIIDYKTSKTKKHPEDLDEDLQIQLYAWGANQIWGIPYDQFESCGLYFLRHREYVPNKTPIDQFTVGAALERCHRVIEQALRGHFPANRGWWCKSMCQAKSVCPVYNSVA